MRALLSPCLLLLAAFAPVGVLSAGTFLPDIVPPTPKVKPKPQAEVRVTPVRATGKRAPDAKPAVPPELEAVREVLTKASYDRYVAEGDPVSRVGPAKAALEFPGLPQGYAAQIAWALEEAAEGEEPRLELTVTVKRSREPEQPPETVATMTVAIPAGQSYLIRCPGAWPDGDLLLVVTAKRAHPPGD